MKVRTIRVRQTLTKLAAAIFIGVVAIGSTLAAPLELPPLVQPASSEHHPGKVIWADLVTPDLAGAKRFYGAMFGWSFRDIPGDEKYFSLAILNGEAVGGLIQRAIRSGSPRQPNWLTFISVRDVNEAQQVVLARGGKMLSAPRTYPQRGRQAVFADPHGAVFAVLQSSTGDPKDELPDPGEWIWSSLVTPDPDTDAAFYQAVFGYEAFDLPSDDGLEHVLLANDDFARVALNARPPDAAKLHPHWLNFIRVINTTDAVAKVVALGGQILVAPHPDRHGGLVAVVADPAGAPFGLLEWPIANTKEVVK
jgi:predicted enzyme related to lactoylglutathione lyase